MKDNIVITNWETLEIAKQEISNSGLDSFHVVADFDRTLTKLFLDGHPTRSLIDLLRHEKHLSPAYDLAAQALFEKYYVIEIDPFVPDKDKAQAMHEWWSEHFDLLKKERLNKKTLEAIVESARIQLRAGTDRLLAKLHTYKIPLLIFSATGLGSETISLYLKKNKQLFDNIHIISNTLEWDKDGYFVKAREPVIHSMNKNEHAIENYPVFKTIKNRKNVLLLGDNISDVGMAKGLDCQNIIKIGFLNESIEKNLEEYKKYFDILILNDGDMEFVNELIEEIF